MKPDIYYIEWKNIPFIDINNIPFRLEDISNATLNSNFRFKMLSLMPPRTSSPLIIPTIDAEEFAIHHREVVLQEDESLCLSYPSISSFNMGRTDNIVRVSVNQLGNMFTRYEV